MVTVYSPRVSTGQRRYAAGDSAVVKDGQVMVLDAERKAIAVFAPGSWTWVDVQESTN